MYRFVLLLALTSFSFAQNFTDRCRSWNISIPGTTVTVLDYVRNGTNLTFPGTPDSCEVSSQIVYGGDICRVRLNVSTSRSSGIVMEAWFPSAWDGRFLSAGNGGLGGCIYYNDLAYAASYGFAAVAANNGHFGDNGTSFLNAPEVVADFAYRSVHTGVMVGKNLTQQYYDAPVNHSYYLGCSTGGRQGMKSAQMFPEDFDGIIAGAPAFDFVHLLDWSAYLSYVAGYDTNSSSFITESLWEVIDAEVLRQCDGLDGAMDGIIEDPSLCYPRFENLLCPQNVTNSTSSKCLNSEQYLRAVKSFEPLYNASGTLIYPRLQPGAHLAAYPYYFAGEPFSYATDWYKYVVYSNPDWDPETFSVNDFTTGDRQDPYNISTWNGNLTRFASRGGKLLTYHGLQDPLISSENSARYYSHLSATMSLSPPDIDAFYRYFQISGMGHCEFGPGAWDIGQEYYGRSPGVSNRNNNVLDAIVAWVEQGRAPEYIEGIKPADDEPGALELFRRRHCRYPTRNVYNGTGNGTDEDGWSCRL